MDRIEARKPLLSFAETKVPLLSSKPNGVAERKSLHHFGFVNASTDVPATASTPGNGSLSAPARIAKSKNRAAVNEAQVPETGPAKPPYMVCSGQIRTDLGDIAMPKPADVLSKPNWRS